jgi:excisionase family DNA binding protein
MAKMFYTTDEAAQKIGVSSDQLKTLVTENKLREFRDGARVMFKVDQVDKLASDRKAGTSAGTKAGTGGPIGLADSGLDLAGGTRASDVISLADTGATTSPSKDDTVVTGLGGTASGTTAGTGAGQQVFKPGEVKSAADTGAQTQIQSAIDDQLSLEGVGSGSGLLDLTRESDDTSLGAELLDEIYPGGDAKGDSGIGSASGIFEQSPGASATGTGGAQATGSSSGLEDLASAPSAVVPAGELGEARDPSSGAFGGFALGSVVVSAVTLIIALCFFNGYPPSWMNMIINGGTMYVLIFGVALAVISVIFGLVGFAVGRAR